MGLGTSDTLPKLMQPGIDQSLMSQHSVSFVLLIQILRDSLPAAYVMDLMAFLVADPRTLGRVCWTGTVSNSEFLCELVVLEPRALVALFHAGQPGMVPLISVLGCCLLL